MKCDSKEYLTSENTVFDVVDGEDVAADVVAGALPELLNPQHRVGDHLLFNQAMDGQ